MLFSSLFLLAAACLQGVVAHPADESREAMEYAKRWQEKSIRSLESCQDQLLKNRELHERRFAKREAWINEHAERRGIKRRAVDLQKRELDLEERQVSCILAPEVTIGPYYLDRMPIRKDNRESQPGVELLLELQFINTRNCQPVVGAYIDMWHANATGVYGGFQQEGTAGATWLRGLQPTDSNGVANFTTIWPGHYRGRAVHTHILAHWGGTVSGNYYTGGSRPHIGQVFYNQNLISTVEALSPYNTNRQPLTTNAADGIFNQQQGNGYNAIATTRQIGNSPSQGYVASITVGIYI